jgi:hypothetical protein
MNGRPTRGLICEREMKPAQARTLHVFIQPRGNFLSSAGTEIQCFVCPGCGRIDARVSDLELFGG